MTLHVYGRRWRQLPTDPGQHPGANRLAVTVDVRFPEGVNLSLVRQQLDNAYLDALEQLDQIARDAESSAGESDAA